jgi:hypothetical protein
MLSNEAAAAIAIGAALLFVVGLGFYLWRSERARREALARLAERRRWVVELRPASLGAGVRLRLTPRERGTWDCRVHTPSRGSTGGTQSGVRKTEFEDTAVRAPGGLLLLGPPMPRETAAFAAAMVSSLDGPLGRRLLAMVIGDLADEVGDLRPVDAPGGRPRVYSTLVSGDPPPVDHDAIESTVRAWLQRFGNRQDFPIVILGARSLRVRLRRDARDPAMLESFIDLALELRERVTRTTAAEPPQP